MVLFVFGFLPLIGLGFELICPGRRERGWCDLPKGTLPEKSCTNPSVHSTALVGGEGGFVPRLRCAFTLGSSIHFLASVA